VTQLHPMYMLLVSVQRNVKPLQLNNSFIWNKNSRNTKVRTVLQYATVGCNSVINWNH